MKLRTRLCATVVAMAFVVAVGAAAKAKDAKSVLLHYDVTVAGSHLASGSYDVQWQTHSPEATVSFMQGNKVVATVEGKVVDRGTTYLTNEVVYGVAPMARVRFRKSASRDRAKSSTSIRSSWARRIVHRGCGIRRCLGTREGSARSRHLPSPLLFPWAAAAPTR